MSGEHGPKFRKEKIENEIDIDIEMDHARASACGAVTAHAVDFDLARCARAF